MEWSGLPKLREWTAISWNGCVSNVFALNILSIDYKSNSLPKMTGITTLNYLTIHQSILSITCNNYASLLKPGAMTSYCILAMLGGLSCRRESPQQAICDLFLSWDKLTPPIRRLCLKVLTSRKLHCTCSTGEQSKWLFRWQLLPPSSTPSPWVWQWDWALLDPWNPDILAGRWLSCRDTKDMLAALHLIIQRTGQSM